MVRDKKKRMFSTLFAVVFINIMITGCGGAQNSEAPEETAKADAVRNTEDAENADAAEVTLKAAEKQEMTGIAAETAKDAQIDFTALQEENPDIFAWIYIPNTQIDYPVLQSDKADDFYESHNAYGKEDDMGAVYIELANLTSMCDFNTVLHGRTDPEESGLFANLYRFADPDFFTENEKIYLYLDGNVLTYEIFAAYEREDTSLIRSYDFTYIAGCEQFLDDLYGVREMNKNLREGWEDLTPYHFLVTLTTKKADNPQKQFVVIAALIEDAAGTIDRVVTE